MGIHGLTTYLRESRSALAHTISFPKQPGHQPPKSTTIVIDGWSFIFELASLAGLHYIYGGEYEAFSRLITQVVTAWRAVGLHVCFVFDGVYPALKFPTLVSRATQTTIQVGLLFFRTSAQARSTPRFLRENSLLPPLSFTVCVQTLRDLVSSSAARVEPPWLEVHFADEEGDPYAVALAARLNAYVVGRDSDFVVLNADGYQGYIPLDEMIWLAESASAAASDAGSVLSSTDGDDDVDPNGFKTVRKSKTRKREAENPLVGRGIIPPAGDTTLALVCNVYSPTALATTLQLPVSLLPLLGALVGNDFTGGVDGAPRHALHALFFERQLTLPQRITRVAGTLRSLLDPDQKRKRKRPIGSVMELIDAAVHALLLRPPDTMGSGELDAIVERIVEATLQYAIPRSDENGLGPGPNRACPCPLHGAGTCRLVDFLSPPRAVADERPEPPINTDRARVGELYVGAYRRGELSPRALDVLSTGTAWPRIALEDPDKESVSKSVARAIRQWGYAVLDAGVGLPAPLAENDQAKENGAVDSDDELVDVVEENSDDEDPLSPLRDALERLDNPAADSARASALSPPTPLRPKVVTEYVRRGTRLAPEEITVPLFSDLLEEFSIAAPESQQEPGRPLPVQLWPEDLRLTFLLRALGSDTLGVRTLHGARLVAVLAVRWVVARMHARADANPTQKEKQSERWTREEVRAFLSAFSWPRANGKARASEPDDVPGESDEPEPEPVPIEERNIQLVTQVSLAGDAVEHFAQLLLLSDLAPNPMLYFSGLRFHTALTLQPNTVTGTSDDDEILSICLEGLESALMTKPTKAKKKRKAGAGGEAPSTAPPLQQGQRRGRAQAGNMYDVLAAMSA
ncbi:uncharacterized protein B0H18DRAFT_882498 [Fomitopsis serialis]|uniref:uncharacterized protein n=1 Tax=Fomitopsis serialis TaxID=139415 RepID=UPI00200838A3|nr:uncharacterized protein B0H18DRAFT_882498 [Neoantrodia serialis]KAH9918812.1 hypothetical protein B0H18DRAFT_882498 [Neoantrodia serialis]